MNADGMNDVVESTLGLEGKLVLITGGTRGLGLAIARKLCACGCDVLLNYAGSTEHAEEAVRALDGCKGTASLIRADVASPGGVESLMERVRRDHGRLDVFVHSAATWTPMSAVTPDADGFHRDVSVAVTPLLHGIPALAELLPAGGRIIAISSVGSNVVVPRYMSLGVAKAALESQIRYLAVELAGRGITVNAVSTSKLDKGAATSDAGAVKALAARTPAGRLTTLADVADVVALMCTAEAAWIQGQVIRVDGGLGLRA
jgi:enoyl-[acyl-carrier protein] reductase III